MLIYLYLCVPCFAQKEEKKKKKGLFVPCEDSHVGSGVKA